MNQIKIPLIFALAFLSLLSCKKSFLDVTDNSNLNRQSYVKDLTTMEQFLNGIYVMMSTKFDRSSYAAYPEIIADNLKPSLSGTTALVAQYNWLQKSEDRSTFNSISMNRLWQDNYLIIRACNFIIEDVGKYRNENPEIADRLKGQAYGLRALVHFKLVNVFAQTYRFSNDASHAGIPYIKTSDIQESYSRQTVAQVYENIIADLQEAISLLPNSINDIRFMNQAASKALLARVCLFQENYARAKSISVEIATQFPLMTIGAGYPNGLFTNRISSQTEILFQITPVFDFDNPNISDFLGFVVQSQTPVFFATKDITNILRENPGDIRSSWTIDTLNGQNKVKKFPVGVAGLAPSVSYSRTDYYLPIIRSSEMFLIAAEASAKTGDEENARRYLNAIRKRSNPAIADIVATGQALIESIYKERRKELCFEGLRMYDLQRWRQGVNRTDVLPGSPATLAYPSDKAISPIPLQDIKLMGLQQNYGY
jgi:hypothetical protein